MMRLKKKKADERAGGRVVPRRGEAAHHPLSFAQQRLWFLEQLEPDGPYKVPAAFRLRGRLNVEALGQSVNEIISRHEVLRTTFAEIEGRPVQVVAPRLTLTIPVEDLSHLTEVERAEQVKRTAARLRGRPFDLARGPLVGAALVRLAEEEHLFWFLMHHIVSDGWSIGVLLKELSAAYEAFAAGRRPELSELPIQYADFAVWQREWLRGETLARQMRFWKERLAGKVPALELPTDRPRPPVQSYRGAILTHLVDTGLTGRLKELARREGVTPYMLLLAVFKTLLQRHAGQDDIVVGTPIANRNLTELEPLVGFFVNTLVLRTDLSGDPTFGELLGRVREVALGAFAHQDVPFEKLVEELQPERDTSRTPLFQVMFSLQNAPPPPSRMGGVEVSLVDDDTAVSPFDLSFDVTERADGLLCGLEYNTDLFDGATVGRMLKHFAVLLDAATADPTLRLSRLPLLTEEERLQLLVEWNDTAREYPRDRCVHELFEEQAAAKPDAVALVCGGERLTYAQLDERANRLARHLRACGVGAETRVGVLLERETWAAVALLAVLKAGGAWVALDPAYPPPRLSFMLEDAGASVLLTTARLAESLPAHGARLVHLDAEARRVEAREGGRLGRVADADNLAYLVYTSGTTGRPKGILVEHRSLVNTGLAFAAHHGLTPRDRLLQFASFSFDVAAEEFFGAWLAGACAVMRPARAFDTIEEFVRFVGREGVTVANLPASFWAEWLATLDERGVDDAGADGATPDAFPPATLRRVVVGNEKTLGVTLERWRRLVGDRVGWSNAYGPTETTVTASNYEPSGADLVGAAHAVASIVPIGRPIANAEMYVLDARQQPVPVGVVGEIYVGGAGVARGYHRRPAQTAERFLPHPHGRHPGARLYRTGDLGRFLPDGNVEYLGRADEQVKVRGFRVEVGEVEAVLRQHAEVRECVVTPSETGGGGLRLVAYVVPRAQGGAEPGGLRDFLKEQLPEYMIPSAFVRLEAMPLTPNGKLDRKALPAPEGASREASEPYVAPRSELESLIAGVWQEALGVERVGVNDNFFGLGGHSLLMIRVNSRLREALRAELPVVEMFKYPTVSTLAEHLSAERAEPGGTGRAVRGEAAGRAALTSRRRELTRRQAVRSNRGAAAGDE
ncbi:MAG TPA: amino acid adenylation domain-containing protein [Pyrinomonadaceae bacterium]|nr:amino acid adenylation domain-containing protein [Pyrinomonadaceae bacterium]